MLITPLEWFLLICLIIVAFTSWQAKRLWIKLIWIFCFFASLTIYAYQMYSAHSQSKQLDDTRHRLSNILAYGEIAMLNYKGDISVSKDYSLPGPISGWTDGYVKKANNSKQIRYDDDAITYYLEILRNNPKYPFPYYFLADPYHLRGDQIWRKYAQDAVSILKLPLQYQTTMKRCRI
jgi:hypothetical protein